MSKKILLSLIIFLALTSCNHSTVNNTNEDKQTENSCKLPGHSINWLTSYCKLKTGISDTSSRIIIQCIDKTEKKLPPVEECPKRTLIKKEVCTLQRRLNRTEKGQIHCMQTSDNDQKWGAGEI